MTSRKSRKKSHRNPNAAHCPRPDKAAFRTREEAHAFAKLMSVKWGKKFGAYECRCLMWHINTRRK